MITTIAEPSQVGEARRLAGDFARSSGFPEARIGQIALVATELATNLIKHGGGGQLIVERFSDADGEGIECLSLDSGPGMVDFERCLRDGYSTAGSPGNGLGAIARQADFLRVYSRPGVGTALLARFIAGPPARSVSVRIGAAASLYPGELVSGDRWTFGQPAAGATLLVADGSGHGPEADRAATLAAQVFHDSIHQGCVQIVEQIHRALAPTRGAAVAVARIDHPARMIRFVGVGNIGAALVTGGRVHHMVSHNGTAGHTAPRIREFEYRFTDDPMVILHSDGLATRWSLDAYPGLAMQHPALVAGVLLRDHRRGRDDATAVAMRQVA